MVSLLLAACASAQTAEAPVAEGAASSAAAQEAEIAQCDWPDPANEARWSVDTTVEGMFQLNPDALIIDNGDGLWAHAEAARADLLAQIPLWGEIAAVQNEHIFLMDAFVSASARDGMGTVGAALLLDTFAPLLYPETFPAPLTDEQVQEIIASKR